MRIPPFSRESLNPRLVKNDLGDVFQRLIFDVLAPDLPHLHLFPGAGKDGCIDLISRNGDHRTVVECKHIGADGIAHAEKQWNEVAEKLDRNLKPADAPPRGQAQYRPWYRNDRPIRKYIFAVSSHIKNEAGWDKLRDQIIAFFNELAIRKHLTHLANMEVEVLDWSDVDVRLQARPRLAFRWFPSTRVSGFVPIDDLPPVTGFRQYLQANKLPYYSVADHASVHPLPSTLPILNLSSILDRLEGNDLPGVVMTGAGGIGKTRMCKELGITARSRGWHVLSAVGHVRTDSLDKLAEAIAKDSDQRILLLVDYVEQETEFADVVDRMVSLNATHGYRIRFAANSRTTYYHSVVLGSVPHHLQIDLTPPSQGAGQDWMESYGAAVVDHILRHAKLAVDAAHRSVCHGTPVLAVFLAYLRELGRDDDLAQLMGEQDFAVWVSKRIQMTFEQPGVSRELAILITMFPMLARAHSKLATETTRGLFDRLATDGWIEQVQSVRAGAEVWITAHDVLADQVLLAYCRSIPSTIREFLSDLLDQAAAMHTLRAVLIALQRIAGQPLFAGIDWCTLILDKTLTNTDSWSSVRDVVFRTSLLSQAQILELLEKREFLWEGSETLQNFHSMLGGIATRLRREFGNDEFPVPLRNTLINWIKKSASYVDKSNYPLTWGLRLCPGDVAEFVLNWLSRRGEEFDAHYLLVEWLKSGQDFKAVTAFVKRWAVLFSGHPNLSFLVRAWCNAAKEVKTIHAPVLAWLAKHTEREDAQFVCKAWLDANGSFDDVREYMLAWLTKHKETEAAEFVCNAWLDAKGKPDDVREYVLAWLAKHGETEAATFVYEAWLDAKGKPDDVREYVLAWLAKYGETEAAQFVYRAWLDANGKPDDVREYVLAWLVKHGETEAAQFVYRAWLDANGKPDDVREYVLAWLVKHGETEAAQFVYRAWVEAGCPLQPIWKPVQDWLHAHRGEESAVYLTKWFTKAKEQLPIQTLSDILYWCRKFPGHQDVLWRFTSMGSKVFIRELATEVLDTAEVLINSQIDKVDCDPVSRGQVATAISHLVAFSAMRKVPVVDRVNELFLRWMRYPQSYGSDPAAHANIQRYQYAARAASLFRTGRLDPIADDAALRRFVAWLNTWHGVRRAELGVLKISLTRHFGSRNPWFDLDIPGERH